MEEKKILASKNISLDLSKELSKEFCESLQDIDVFIHMAEKSKNPKKILIVQIFLKLILLEQKN